MIKEGIKKTDTKENILGRKEERKKEEKEKEKTAIAIVKY